MFHAIRRNHGMFAWLLAVGTLGASSSAGADEPPVEPHPVLAWPSGPFEVRVAFAQPIDGAVLKNGVQRLIPFEEQLSVLQQARPSRPSRNVPDSVHRGLLRIAATRLEDGGRTLTLITDPHPLVGTYSLHINGIRSPGQPAPGESIDLLYGLGGVEAVWYQGGVEEKPAWSGWWPDLDPGIVRRLTIGSVEHERSLARLGQPGRLVLSTLVVLPKGHFTLRLVSNGPIAASVAGEDSVSIAVDEPKGAQKIDRHVESTGDPIDLSVTLTTGIGNHAATLRASYLKEEEGARDVRLAHERLLVPWASTTQPLPIDPPSLPRNLAGGDPARGESIFFGEQARCSACHAIGKKGGIVGPELGHQFERPPAQVYRDIAEPGAWINPDYVAYTVALKDGRILVGVVHAEGAAAIRVTDTDAKTTVVPRAEIEEFRPSATSIMPVGLTGTLGEGPLRDLLAFLTSPPAGAVAR